MPVRRSGGQETINREIREIREIGKSEQFFLPELLISL
jgi:hypothetical protein